MFWIFRFIPAIAVVAVLTADPETYPLHSSSPLAGMPPPPPPFLIQVSGIVYHDSRQTPLKIQCTVSRSGPFFGSVVLVIFKNGVDLINGPYRLTVGEAQLDCNCLASVFADISIYADYTMVISLVHTCFSSIFTNNCSKSAGPAPASPGKTIGNRENEPETQDDGSSLDYLISPGMGGGSIDCGCPVGSLPLAATAKLADPMVVLVKREVKSNSLLQCAGVHVACILIKSGDVSHRVYGPRRGSECRADHDLFDLVTVFYSLIGFDKSFDEIVSAMNTAAANL
jgi:hypothetical protein